MPITRPRREQDIARCVELLRAIYLQDAYPAKWPRDPAGWIAAKRTLAAWVSEDRGELVGHAALTAPDPQRDWSQWREALELPSQRLGVVRRLFVAAGWRRKGVATTLLHCVQREAAARDLRLVLDVAVHNQAAITFWQQHGWRRVGEALLPLGDEGQVLPLVLLVAPRGAPL